MKYVQMLILMICVLFLLPSIAMAAERIVSLKPNITEILFALGVGDRVVGVTTWCDYPAATQRIAKVADYVQPNVEALLAVRPDLIITSTENSRRGPIEQLQRLRLRVAILPFTTVSETLTSIERIGTLVDAAPAAAALVRQMRAQTVQRRSPAAQPKTALVLVSQSPMVAAGPASFIGELLELAGATNVILARQPSYPHISDERLLALEPDVIIRLDHATTPLLRPGPRMLAGIDALRARLGDAP